MTTARRKNFLTHSQRDAKKFEKYLVDNENVCTFAASFKRLRRPTNATWESHARCSEQI